MKILLTCGPSYEPLDQVRRLTNFSTGALGARLSEIFQAAGHEVHCLRGVQATAPPPGKGVCVEPFTTNADLLARMNRLAMQGGVGAVFMVAALCDYELDGIEEADGTPVSGGKIPSRSGGLVVRLRPALKLMSRLRDLFPASLLVGWKYELDGSRLDAMERARRQLRECRSDLCVVNGAAYGAGFGLCGPDRVTHDIPDADALGKALCDSLPE